MIFRFLEIAVPQEMPDPSAGRHPWGGIEA